MHNLPKFWKRLYRPETERSPGKQRSERYWRKLREKDVLRKTQWPIIKSTLANVERELTVNIQKDIQQRLNSGKNRISVLDAGCGFGVTLNDLKKIFGKKVRTVGLTLRQNPGVKYEGVDRLIKGRISKIKPRETYDIIYSYIGAHYYTKQKTTALENTISMLKSGGTAILDIGIYEGLKQYESELNEMKTVLAANGIKDWKFIKSSVLYFKKPSPNLPN